MSNNLKFKVSYVTVTGDGLEKHSDVNLDDISMDERKDVKSLIFLPVDIVGQWDVTSVLKGFTILEHLYLPSSMTTTISKVAKDCPMLKDLLILKNNSESVNLNQMVAKFTGHTDDEKNSVEFRAFVDSEKDGKQTFLVSSKQVDNHILVDTAEVIRRLTPSDVEDYISGEHGIAKLIDDINDDISDSRCKIDITRETLESLLTIFVEKGVTFNEFTIDFSKLYDKIESYKAIAKSVNQVSTKEQIENNIVDSYKNVLNTHYEGVLKGVSENVVKLLGGVDSDSNDMLLADLSGYVITAIVEHPDFDDNYQDPVELGKILDDIPSRVSAYISKKSLRDRAKSALASTAEMLEADKDNLNQSISEKLDSKVSIDDVNNMCKEKLDTGDSKALLKKVSGWVLDGLIEKNLGNVTKADVSDMLDGIANAMKSGNFVGKKLQELILSEIAEYLTEEERKGVIVDLIAGRGYSAFKVINT